MKDYSHITEQANRSRGRLTLKEICRRNNVSYRAYLAWIRRRDKKQKNSATRDVPVLAELVAVEDSPLRGCSAKASVCMAFDNGLRLERQSIAVDALIRMLTLLKPALCSD